MEGNIKFRDAYIQYKGDSSRNFASDEQINEAKTVFLFNLGLSNVSFNFLNFFIWRNRFSNIVRMWGSKKGYGLHPI